MGDFEGEVCILLDQQDAEPEVPVDLDDFFEDRPDQDRGDAERGFIEHEAGRLAHERPGDGEHLLFAAAERPGLLLHPLCEAWKNRERLVHARRNFFFALPQVGPHPQVFVDGQVGKDHPSLRGLRDPAGDDPVGWEADDVPIPEDDLPGGRLEESGDRAEGGGFPRAVCADERHDLAFGDAERDFVEGADRPVGNRKVPNFEDWRAHSPSLPR